MKIKKYYFVGNAHIDPVWMWRWQDGAQKRKGVMLTEFDYR